ncbi:HAD-IA family hydrolase [Luethyella okanaganae]|uniref:HAD-IA family hydrolase n=1 Tax=Luethyella okanaganae TaxID=69372 RepID=A0ABW1VH19_9MICO
MSSDVYFFDCDKTLYAYDFRKRLPRLAELTGSSQYHLAKTWWEGGHETAAEAGEYTTSDEYLAAFEIVTGVALTLEQWQQARATAMSPIEGAIAVLRRAAEHATVSLLSNNPIIFRDSLAVLAPDIFEVLDGNDLVSAVLGARKPELRIYTRAMSKFGVAPENAILIDDSAANVRGAREAGMHAFQLVRTSDGHNTGELADAVEAFAARSR